MQRWLQPRVGYALLAALYVLSFPYHPGLRSPNELCRLWQSRAIVEQGTLNLNLVLMQLGMVGDLSCTAVVDTGGQKTLAPCVGPDAPHQGVVSRFYYPSKAPLLSFLGVPVYWVLSKLGPVSELEQVLFSRLFVTIVPTLAMLWLLRRFLLAYCSEEVSDLVTITYGLGTMAFSYAESFMSHQLTAVLLFAAFFVAWKVERGEWKERAYLLAGAAAGATVLNEYTGALGVVCVAAYVVAARWKQWAKLGSAAGLVVVGSLPFLAALMAYHQACFGGPLVSGYKFLNDAQYMGWHQGGFLGIKTPDVGAFFLSLFSPLRGLFALSPFLLVALWGVKDLAAKDRPQFISVAVLLAANAYFTSSFAYSSWGWTVGPRHLTPMLPFLMLPFGLALERLRGAGGSATQFSAAAGLAVSSVLVTGVVGFVNYVPDNVSVSFWALAVPLLSEGTYPVSALAALVPNPASGALLLALLLAVTLWLLARFSGLKAVPMVMLAALVLHLGLLRFATRNDPDDVNAKNFIKSVWVAPNGVKLQL